MRSGPTFHLFGIPVRVDPGFVVVLGVLGIAGNYGAHGVGFLASWMVIASTSILLHELGHAVAFRAFGCRPSIALVGLGGLTSGQGRISPGRHLVVSLAGPLSTLLLVGLPALAVERSLVNPSVATSTVLSQIVWVNVGWAVINLVPVLPLDGGQVVASLLEMGFKERGRQIALWLSLAIGGGLVALGIVTGQFVFTMIGGFLLVMNVGQVVAAGRPTGATESVASPFSEAHRALVHGQPQVAEHLVRQSMTMVRSADAQLEGIELLAWCRVLGGDPFGAQQVVASAGRVGSQILRGAVAVASGRRDEGVALVTWGFLNEPPGPARLYGAIGVARAGATAVLAHELAVAGPPGQAALHTVRDLLAYVNLHDDAAVVGAVLGSAAGPPPPPGSGYSAAPAFPAPIPAPIATAGPPAPAALGGSGHGWPSTPPSSPPAG